MKTNENKKDKKTKGNILAVFKKEMRRFFGDKRMVVTLIVPGLMIYIIYSLMGNYMSKTFNPQDNYTYKVCVKNLPASVDTMIEATDINIEYKESADPKSDILNENLDLYVVFPEKFDELVLNYTPSATEKAPNVQIFYNSSVPNSANIYSVFKSTLDYYESALANRFDVNGDLNQKYDLANEGSFTEIMFSTLMPMLLIILAFSACMSIVPESFAGEKERGTIATLLVTPIKRSHLAIGKISALSSIAMLSGLCSFTGVMLALPKLTGADMDTSIYGPLDYICILAIILTTVLFFTSLISVISNLANSVKEAMSYVSPLMLLVTILGMSKMFSKSDELNSWLFLIPGYNTVQSLSGIFSMSYEPLQIILTCISNLACTGLLVFFLTKMFNNEKIMFRR